MYTVVVRDESVGGRETARSELTFPTETITIRELIRERVYQEVQDHNRRGDGAFRGLVAPRQTARGVEDSAAKRSRAEVDWKEQFDVACRAFEQNQILVLAGDRQATRLDESVELTRGVDVTFVRLVMLVGG